MTTVDTTDHDDWLVQVRRRLIATCELYTAQLYDLTTNNPDPADADTHAAMLVAARQSLADATQAIHRIDDARYGTCEACGGTIPSERLEILPHARYCVSCQSRR